MTANNTADTTSTSLAGTWLLRTAGAVAVGALVCFGTMTPAHADSHPPVVGSGVSCVSDAGGQECSLAANTVVFRAPPMPAAVAESTSSSAVSPITDSASPLPQATLADANQERMLEGELLQAILEAPALPAVAVSSNSIAKPATTTAGAAMP